MQITEGDPTFGLGLQADILLDEEGRVAIGILLAVERLEWLGPDGQDYLAVGLTDELVTTLSGYGDNLTVVRAPAAGLGMAAGFESRPDGLAYHLLGSVRQEGDDIRICIKLVEAADGLVAWSETFAHRLSSASPLAILEQVARQVAATVLDPHGILYQSLKRKTAPLLGSYLAVFRYHEYQERFAPQTHLQAREALEQSVRENPGYADAWAALANVYLGEALFGFNQTRSLPVLVEKCYETAQQAVALEPRNVIANYILAMTLFYRQDKAQFLAVAQHTLDLAPHRPDNLAVIGMHLALSGQWEHGLKLVTEAMHLNPFHPPWYHLVLSLYHIHFGQYPAALAAIGRFAGLDFFPFQVNLAVIHGHLGNLPEARRCLKRMFELWPDARHRLQEILDFWFPFEDVADVFAAGLTKAGFSKATADRVETIQPTLRGDRFSRSRLRPAPR